MDTLKQKFCTELEHKVNVVLKNVMAQHSIKIYRNDLKIVIHKISEKLPKFVFTTNKVEIENEITEHIAREYILFQLQDNAKVSDFENLLANFIYRTATEINAHYHKR